MASRPNLLTPLLACTLALAARPAPGGDEPAARRHVLVELFSSQGCDMCPLAEQNLGKLGTMPGVVPVAFHVDYFDRPWKDRFSDPLYSRRQWTYDRIYAKPKPAQYGLYYTPMLMVDGIQSVNGRDPQSAAAAIRAAAARPPAVLLDVDLTPRDDGRAGTTAVRVTPRSRKLDGRSILVCGVLREDGVRTEILAGENEGKILVARFPARQTKYEVIQPTGTEASSVKLDFQLDPSWEAKALRLAVFAQDQKTGEVLQALDRPWATPTPPGRETSR